MLGISSVLLITNLRITEYYMMHFATFRYTELTKMNVYLEILYNILITIGRQIIPISRI